MAPPTQVAEVHVADRLFLGREIPGGGFVSDEEWAAFLSEVVTPHFPDGLTIWRAQGQWLDPRGNLVQEPVFVLEVFHRGGTDAEASVQAIAIEYKRRFRQDAVLRITAPIKLHFFE
ncbi:MAG: DUF3574 domain-containing protein [Betaproteobacteria bacterium]|nr:DUF3574 domain-containing protein [Betaproteobacteria bacterium]